MIIFRKNIADVSSQALERFLTRARKAARLKGSVHVLVTSNAEMRGFNRQFRRKDKPTDVLSFPSPAPFQREFAGDLAISADIAAQNAREFGHSTSDELKILILHGVLHLAGYDHENDSGEMARLESRLRRDLKLRDNLIDRSVNVVVRAARNSAASRNGASSAAKKPASKSTVKRASARATKRSGVETRSRTTSRTATTRAVRSSRRAS